MFYPRFDSTHIICDNPSCFRNIPGLGFDMLRSLATQAGWLTVRERHPRDTHSHIFWHFCSAECRDAAKACRDLNRRALHTGRSWKTGAIRKQAERLEEKQELCQTH